ALVADTYPGAQHRSGGGVTRDQGDTRGARQPRRETEAERAGTDEGNGIAGRGGRSRGHRGLQGRWVAAAPARWRPGVGACAILAARRPRCSEVSFRIRGGQRPGGTSGAGPQPATDPHPHGWRALQRDGTAIAQGRPRPALRPGSEVQTTRRSSTRRKQWITRRCERDPGQRRAGGSAC
ncbi:hypothetical protein RZS08_10720, partial [Arthrospira platensis SPKY1]|nr:hypothetical protein [Arthrospira platensis SPKY1]